MRLTFSGLSHCRYQTSRFAQLTQLSPLDASQYPRKRRRLECRRPYSTENKNAACNGNTPAAGCDEQPSSSFNQQPTDRANELLTSRGSAAYNVPFRSASARTDPTLRLSTTPMSREPSKWHLTVEQLESESDVGHTRDIGSKLVDNPTHACDISLWKELLLYRQRHYGDYGAIEIWKGMRERCGGIELPVMGEDARFFWQSFVTTGLRHETFLIELVEYAQDAWNQKRRRWHGLYGAVVGGYLEMSSVKQAVQWHLSLKRTHLLYPSDISRVFKRAMSSKDSLKAFKSICRTTRGHKIYSDVVPVLWRCHMVDEALDMHRLLLLRNDGPQTVEEALPLLQHVHDYGSEKQELSFLRQMAGSDSAHKDYWVKLLRHATTGTHGQADNNQAADEAKENKRAAGSTLNHDSETKFTDEFGARLFATRAFSFELILGGMEMFSVEAIGPLTLRQMALRATNAGEVAQQVKELKRRGISLRDCAYSRVVKELVSKNDSAMLRDILHSDQHPDVMEDLNTQEVLYASYTLSQDWRRAQMAFTVLSILSNEDPKNVNIHFRNAVNTKKWSATAEIIEQAKENHILLSERSIIRVSRLGLPLRQPGQRPHNAQEWSAALWNLLGTLQYVASSGSHVLPGAWKEGLKRLGMTGRLTQLETLCLWIADYYSSISAAAKFAARDGAGSADLAENLPLQMSAAQARSELGTIFSHPLQQGIIAWGFGLRPPTVRKLEPIPNPGSDNGETIIPWVRGVALLRQLKAKGVSVPEPTVQKACRYRLAVLFGRPRRSNRKRNRAGRHGNPYSLGEVLAEIDKAWGGPMFHDFRGSQYDLVNPRILSPVWKL